MLFKLIQVGSPENWEALISKTNYWLVPEDQEKLAKLLSSTVKCILIEYEYIDKDYRDTYSNFYSKKFAHYPSRTIRLHFFGRHLENQDIWRLDEFKGHYIGYSIIRPTRVRSIGRTIIDPSKLPNIQGHMCQAEYDVHLLGQSLKVRGFPFITQDSDVTVCAHAAAWMLFRYFSEKYRNYSEVYPFQITHLTSDHSHGRIVPSTGVTISQLAEIFFEFGFHPRIYTRGTFDNPEMFKRILYYYVESGIPVVAGMAEKEHAVTIFGHRMNLNPLETKSLYYSSDFLDGFIFNDDNSMPYGVLPLKHTAGCEYALDDINSFVVPLYEKIYLTAEHIETLFSRVTGDSKLFALRNQSPSLYNNQIVYRIFLTSAKSYKAFWRKYRFNQPLAQLYLQIPMPRFIWVCELTTLDRYTRSNPKVLGEIIWDATASQNEVLPYILHYPELFTAMDRNIIGPKPNDFLKIAFKTYDEYDIYKNNLVEINPCGIV